MLNILKMDMHRLLHSKVFYVSIVFITIMAAALVMSGMSTTLDGLLGAAGPIDVHAADAGDDFMNTAMGTGVIFILLGIILTIFVCGDYAGGFAKNIFTVHANPWRYIGGKMLSMGLTSGILLGLYTLLSVLSLAFIGEGVILSGSVLGLIFFLVEKWLVSIALGAVVLLVVLFTRNYAWGITAAFLVSTGGLTMGVALLAERFNLSWLTNVFSVTISGASQLCSLAFDPLIFLRVLLISAVWVIGSCLFSNRVLLTKDI